VLEEALAFRSLYYIINEVVHPKLNAKVLPLLERIVEEETLQERLARLDLLSYKLAEACNAEVADVLV
jgi:hypothetical protein